MREPRTHREKLVLLVSLGFLLMPLYITVLRPNSDPLSDMNLKLFLGTKVNIAVVKENSSIYAQNPEKNTSIADQTGDQTTALSLDLSADEERKSMTEKAKQIIADENEEEKQNPVTDDSELIRATPVGEEKQKEENFTLGNDIPNTDKKDEENSIKPKQENTEAGEMTRMIEEKETYSTKADDMIQCDISQSRSDTCVIHGDVRVHGPSSSIILAKFSQPIASEEVTWNIRPYARKWEPSVMQLIRELSLRSSAKPDQIPQCALRHNVPAIVFSTGGFLGNFFHDFTDVLIPLFITSYQYKGEVHFLVNNFNHQWINKYNMILKRLSRYEIIDLDRDERVHCFPIAHVGLLSHQDLNIDPSKSPNGYSMNDFREFMRNCFSLTRKSLRTAAAAGRRRPRLLLINRKGPRELTNRRKVVSLARSLGYKVVVAGPAQTKNISQFTQIVNSCDVIMGVHGAGLTNMIFLPDEAALIQIIPWGGLKYACSHDFGEPAPSMRIRYLEYEIKEEESSLIKQYPRDHPVFTDPFSIHKQGWNALWDVFLNKQSVKLDVKRFKGVLQEALQAIPH